MPGRFPVRPGLSYSPPTRLSRRTDRTLVSGRRTKGRLNGADQSERSDAMDVNRLAEGPQRVADPAESGSLGDRPGGETRREFGARVLGALGAFGLSETLWARGLLADGEQEAVGKWFADLVELTHDLRGQKL